MNGALERNLDLLREQGLRAIGSGAWDRCKRVFQRHIDFVKEYLDVRQRMGLGVREGGESGIFYRGPNVLNLITNSLRELAGAAFRSGENDAIRIAGLSLLSGQVVSVDRDALSVFNTFLLLSQEFFSRALEIGKLEERQRAISVFCEAEKSLADYMEFSILPRSGREATRLNDYAYAMICTYRVVLKHALDTARVKEFVSVLTALGDVLHARVGITQQSWLAFYGGVAQAKRLTKFSLGAWATGLYDKERLSPESYFALFSKLAGSFSDFTDLTRLAIDIVTDLPGGEPIWANWQMESRFRDGELGGSIAVMPDWLTKYYLILGLRAITAEVDADQLYRSLSPEIGKLDSSTIRVFLDALADAGSSVLDSPDKWSPLTGGGERAESAEAATPAVLEVKRRALLQIWEHLLELRRRDEEQQLVQAPVPEQLRTAFRSKFRETFSEEATIRNIALDYGFFEDHTHEAVPEGIRWIAFQPVWEQKRWFLPGSESALNSMAENFGRQFAGLESSEALRMMLSVLEPAEVNSPTQAILLLDAFINSIDANDQARYLIFSTAGHEFNVSLFSSRQFDAVPPSGARRLRGSMQGSYRGLAWVLIQSHASRLPPSVLCGRLDRLGKWRQFSAGATGEDVLLEVRTVDEIEAREEVVREPSLRKRGNAELSEQDAILDLQRRVRIRVGERFDFQVRDATAAIRIDISEIDTPNPT